MAESSPTGVENTVGKGKIARYEQFLLFPQSFQKTCTADMYKPGLVWERVNQYFAHYSFQAESGEEVHDATDSAIGLSMLPQIKLFSQLSYSDDLDCDLSYGYSHYRNVTKCRLSN